MSETVVNLPATTHKREIQTVVDAVPILDTARFEHMQRVAAVLARSTMIPETLRCEGPKDKRVDLPFEQILSNCFLVVNQATRWGFDPFAVISCCSVVHGRLSYEGKLVSAVLDAKLGIQLHHHFTGNPHGEDYRIYLSDQPFTDEIIAELTPGFSKNGWRTFDGSVAEWKTTGVGSPWAPKNYKRMLIYRGTRDWTRIYESALMLGVYSDDEMIDLMDDARARRAIPVQSISLADRLSAAKLPGNGNADGFSHEHVTRETNGQTEEPQPSQGDASHSETPHHATEPSATESHSSDPAVSPVIQTSAPPVELAPQLLTGGNSSQQSSDGSSGDTGGGDGVTEQAPSPSLPEGWAIVYCSALRRAQKPISLPKFATQFWAEYGGWEVHKDTEDGATAAAIYNVFKENFGDRDAVEAMLREIV